jgi:hypothetical protein
MSLEYAKYLDEHIENVKRGYDWLGFNLPEILEPIEFNDGCRIVYRHDLSKLSPEEYEQYDNYFYGKEKTEEVKTAFNHAWLHHIHNNPHHWQHWVLINDDPNLGEIILDMPYDAIVEMICDWWAFSWKRGDLMEIFKWYDERKAYIKLSDKTRKTVEDILEKIRVKLEENMED